MVFPAFLQDLLELLEFYARKLILLALHVFLVLFAELHVFSVKNKGQHKLKGCEEECDSV